MLIERYAFGMQPEMSASEYTEFPVSFPHCVARQPLPLSDPSVFPPCLISIIFTGRVMMMNSYSEIHCLPPLLIFRLVTRIKINLEKCT